MGSENYGTTHTAYVEIADSVKSSRILNFALSVQNENIKKQKRIIENTATKSTRETNKQQKKDMPKEKQAEFALSAENIRLLKTKRFALIAI